MIGELFIISPGKRLRKEDMIPGDKPFVGASDSNNGVTAFVSNSNASEDSNVLGVNYNGSVTESFYHPYSCIFSDDVKRFKLRHHNGNKYVYLFLKTMIRQQKVKYTYGYKFSEQRMQRQPIMLPVDDEGKPDYVFMEEYMREREQKLIHDYIEYARRKLSELPNESLSLGGVRWKEFYVSDVFTKIQRGKRLKTEDHIPGNVPYVSSSAMNNGVDDFIGNTEGIRKFQNCITIANSGSVGKTFFHEYEFIASDHVTALQAPHMNKYIYMFIATVTKRLDEKYSFNREINEARINREKIMLPIDDEGKPDWEFMTQYMKAIEERLYLRYLESKASRLSLHTQHSEQ